jgi:autotransporter-associated beta strand protein
MRADHWRVPEKGALRMKKTALFACAAAFFAVAKADSIYTITESITSGGIDLTALGDGYRKDAIAGKAAGANLPIAITGRVVHASGLTPENPFVVSNITADSYFILKDADLVGKTPVEVRGTGTTYFPETTLTNDSVDANGLFRARSTAQIDNLYVSSKDKFAMMYMTNNTFYVRKNTYIGRDGFGSLYTTVTSLGRGNNSSNALTPWLGRREEASLYLGVSATQGMVSQGKLHTKNVYVRAWNVYFGGTKTAKPVDAGDDFYAADVTLENSNGLLWMLCAHVNGSVDSIIRFRGGRMWSEGWGYYITFENNCSANLICQGEMGYPIDLAMTKYAPFVTWNSGATGHLIMRGDSDVYLYGGDGQGQSTTMTLEDGSKLPTTEGGVPFRDPDHRIDWMQTGDLQFRADNGLVARVFTSYFFPSNSWNGGVKVNTSSSKPDFRVNLLGTSQACNSLFGGGKLTNGAARASSIYIGSHGNACQFDATLCGGGAINIVKRGTGAISLMKPIPYTFSLEQGSAVIPANSTFTTPGSLVTAAGTYIALQGSTFTPPADYDMNAATTATFVPSKGGVLVLGGDGADQTVDFSKISGAGVVRKIGANTVTLVNVSAFTGTFDVQGGTLALAASAGTANLSTVSVSAGATIDLASGVKINVETLSVRGVAGVPETSYGGAEGATAMDGVTGGGSIYVAPVSATWTGAVDDDPENLGNWTGLSSAAALTTGRLTVNFSSSDPTGAWNVSKPFSFKGLVFPSAVASFSFKKTGDLGRIAIGEGGVSIADDRTAATYLDFHTPVDFTANWSELTIGQNIAASFHAPLGGVANAGQSIVKQGTGTIYLYTTNSTYDGSLIASNGYVQAYGNEPFGPIDAAGTSRVYIEGYKTAKVYLNDVYTSKNFTLHSNADHRNTLYSSAGTTNTIAGNVTSRAVNRINVADNSVLYLDGGFGTLANRGDEYVNWSGSGIPVFRKKPFYAGSMEASIANMHFYCTGNLFNKIYAWSDNTKPTYDPYNCWNGNIKFGCDRAFDSTGNNVFIAGIMDLNGTDQRLGSFKTKGTVKSIGKAGTLRLACNSLTSDFNNVTPSTGDFVGSVNLIIEANNNFTFGITNRAISATGNVEVVRGTMKFCGTASWLNATNVTVSGGTLVVPHSKTLGRYSEVHLKAGCLQLADGVEQKVKFLYLNGSEEHVRVGVYGALDNESVPAAHRTARITGPGVINVMGEFAGAVLIFK